MVKYYTTVHTMEINYGAVLLLWLILWQPVHDESTVLDCLVVAFHKAPRCYVIKIV